MQFWVCEEDKCFFDLVFNLDFWNLHLTKDKLFWLWAFEDDELCFVQGLKE
jgi:hypothetical protein